MHNESMGKHTVSIFVFSSRVCVWIYKKKKKEKKIRGHRTHMYVRRNRETDCGLQPLRRNLNEHRHEWQLETVKRFLWNNYNSPCTYTSRKHDGRKRHRKTWTRRGSRAICAFGTSAVNHPADYSGIPRYVRVTVSHYGHISRVCVYLHSRVSPARARIEMTFRESRFQASPPYATAVRAPIIALRVTPGVFQLGARRRGLCYPDFGTARPAAYSEDKRLC